MSALDYPVMLRLDGQPVLLVGAGVVALGRLRQLLEVGARVRVIAPVAGEEIQNLAHQGRIDLVLRPFEHGDCSGARFVFAATNDRRVSEAVAAEARQRGILVNAADIPELCDFTIPSIGREGPVTVAVSTSGQAPGLARHLRKKLMDELGSEIGALAKLIGRLRKLESPSAERTQRLRQLVESEAADMIAERDWRGLRSVMRGIWKAPHPPFPVPPMGTLRGPEGEGGDVQLDVSREGGCAFLVGAGPGDPSLLTLRAAAVLREADVVLYDRLVHPETLRHARVGALLIYVGKEGGGEQVAQEEINRRLVAYARRGKRVVRLKGGDPFVFGRGGEEALALARAGVPFEVVPGVSSGVAAPAAAGIPVTHRGLSTAVTFATASATASQPDWEHLARSPTLVLFMVGGRTAESARSLVAAGRSKETPAAIIESGTWSQQQVVRTTLGELSAAFPASGRGAGLGPRPTLLVVGEVVALRDELVLSTAAMAEEYAS